MKTLVRKIKNPIFLKIEFITGAIMMAAALVALPVGILIADASLLANPYLLGVVLAGMLFFGLVGYFCILRPYLLYRKYPEVQVETDGEYLYIHANKEAKIPLSSIEEITSYPHLPFAFQQEFFRWVLLHLLSEEYGDIDFEIYGYGEYKLRFVSHVTETVNELTRYIDQAMNASSDDGMTSSNNEYTPW